MHHNYLAITINCLNMKAVAKINGKKHLCRQIEHEENRNIYDETSNIQFQEVIVIL